MTDANIDRDIVVAPEARLEEGLADDAAIPVATAQLIGADDSVVSAVATFETSHANHPVAIASQVVPNYDDDEEEATPRPDLLSATVIKSTKNAKVGIGLKEADGAVTISSLKSNGLFSETPFEIGDRIMSVNGKNCEGKDAATVANLLRNAENIVTVVVRSPNGRSDLVSSMVMKEHAEASVGLGIRQRHGKLIVSKVAENGMFAHSLLNVGDTCLSINGVKCTPNMDATEFVARISSSPSFVTIVAKTEHVTGIVVSNISERGLVVADSPAAVNAVTTPVRTEQEITDAQRRGCCIVIIAIVAAIIMGFIFAGVTRRDDDYYSGCGYIYCNACGNNCYDYTTGFYEYCCQEELTYSCTGLCPNENCAEMLCETCGYNCFNETTFEYYFCCEEQYEYTCTGACLNDGCEYQKCEICGYDCYNETTFVYDFCCKEQYELSCTGACPNDGCDYLLCETCGYECYNETTFTIEYCCEDRYTLTCNGSCP